MSITAPPVPHKLLSMSPKKFLLWLFLVSITMFFAALTSAYLVKRSQGDWLYFTIPSLFGYTSCCIVCSSIVLQYAYVCAKRKYLKRVKPLLFLTLLLGTGFLWGQYMGWQELTETEVYLVGHPAGSFIYVISGAHALHIIGGIVYLLWLTLYNFRGVQAKYLQSIGTCVTYWHFVGVLWLYLYAFFLINQ